MILREETFASKVPSRNYFSVFRNGFFIVGYSTGFRVISWASKRSPLQLL